MLRRLAELCNCRHLGGIIIYFAGMASHKDDEAPGNVETDDNLDLQEIELEQQKLALERQELQLKERKLAVLRKRKGGGMRVF